MKYRRNRMESRADILRAIRAGPCGKDLATHVMYKSNLSWTVMQEFLRELEQMKMVAIERKDNRFRGRDATIDGPEAPHGARVIVLTQRGRDWLASYEKLLEAQNPEASLS
jgi:predicted transcriptional regulator